MTLCWWPSTASGDNVLPKLPGGWVCWEQADGVAGLRGLGLEAGWPGLLSQSCQRSVTRFTKPESVLLERTPGFSKNDATPFMAFTLGKSAGGHTLAGGSAAGLCVSNCPMELVGDCSVGSIHKPHSPLPKFLPGANVCELLKPPGKYFTLQDIEQVSAGHSAEGTS